MRFHKSFAALLAASISISGCSPFQRDQRQVEGSFRTAPTSELLTMAERYERQGEYAHAARLYEELLKGDPSRTQVRSRLQSLAAYGVVSPQTQEVLAESVGEIVAEHQRQLAEVESQREIDRHLASMTPVSTPDGYQLVDTSVARGVARVQTPVTTVSRPQETVAATTTVPQTVAAESESAQPFDDLPSPPLAQSASRSSTVSNTVASASNPIAAFPTKLDAWQQTVIRSQEDVRPQSAASTADAGGDSASENRAPISRVVSSGSRLWHAANAASAIESANTSAEAVEGAGSAIHASPEPVWAVSPAVTSTEFVSLSTSERTESDWRVLTSRIDATSPSADSSDPFWDPIVASEEGSTATPSNETESVPAGDWFDSNEPLQQAQSAFTLWQVSGSAERTVPALVELLEHNDKQVVEVACYFLGELGPAASEAAVPLRTVCENSGETTSILAAEALSKIAPSEVASIEHLVQAAESNDDESRLLAAITLGGVDHQHEAAVVPALAILLDDENPEIRSAAALSLGGWGTKAAGCLTKLEELALGDVPEVSDAARVAMECIEK